MRLTSKGLLLGLVAIMAARLFAMALMPFADTSEPRYAEIARLMAVSGDWITPWFEPGVPFWGKPPLAFWTQALSIRLFGLSEFAVRLPSWLAMLGVLALVHACGRRLHGEQAARWATLVFATMLLPFASAGAVLTDPFLALGMTLSMVSFLLAPTEPRPRWRYGFFVGLAIGLLAKGPLTLVLVAGALVPWMLWHRNARACLRALPWAGGTALMLTLTLPWYIAAEIKTPGFFQYFIVGEHLLRFIDPGWEGDRYGSAHQRPYGSIWLDWLLATLPWGAAWLGMALWPRKHASLRQRVVAAAMLLTPAAALALGVLAWAEPTRYKTEKQLVQQADAMRGDDPFYFVGSRPFSARYYSRGAVGLVEFPALDGVLPKAGDTVYLAIAKNRANELLASWPGVVTPLYVSRRYALLKVEGAPR